LRDQAAVETSPLQRLTDRETPGLAFDRPVGQSTRQIARGTSSRIKTIEHYREKIKEKLNLELRSELVQYAVALDQNPRPDRTAPEPDSDR